MYTSNVPQRTAAQTKTACPPVKDWRPQLPQRRPPKCPIRRSGSALFSQRRGVLAEQLENIFTDFLQYFGTSLCPCWDNGKWKCVIRTYPPLIFELGWFLCCHTRTFARTSTGPCLENYISERIFWQQWATLVAATSLLKTFRLSIKRRSLPLKMSRNYLLI